ncbi:MAG: preprotein translocase subunit SecA [Calditrichaeota bacterium]|nr:preprotein translocase subunit SecA [Calditrichota bacterium]
MLTGIFSSLFGSKYDRQLKKIWPMVADINRHFEHFRTTLSDDDLPRRTEEFQQRIKAGETSDDLLPEAFALVKDACRRALGRQWLVVGQPVVWDMVPYDVQLIGGIVLHEGKISEMATGEGKTLVATMPLYLNALEGRGAHLITVNDYLAQRDSDWMGGIFQMLGLSVGCILNSMNSAQRRAAYACDITYGTNNEFGFDYLRDNMAIAVEDIVQRGHHYSIVDEVDSVLVDEARTPLIIAGPVRQSTQLYEQLKPSVERLVRAQRDRISEIVSEAEKLLASDKDEDQYELGRLVLKAYRAQPKHKRLTKLTAEEGVKALMRSVENDYLRDKVLHELDEELLFVIDEKQHTIDLTDEGRQLLASYEGSDADLFLLPDLAEEIHAIESRDDLEPAERERQRDELNASYAVKAERIQNISQLLRAYSLYEKDVEYVVQDGKVLIVDEFTGRLMPGRRYSDGLHQAIEAKEGVKIEGETQTIATITLQNYFRLYGKLAGMTGTAETEEGEFWDIYKLEVVVIPTNEKVRRVDQDDVIFKTKREKFNAIIEEIKALHDDGLPVLVGTTSVDVSETLSRMLRRQGIPHDVLNAKQHQREAEIVKNAGQPGAVTIATNMAGRGTDIKLGAGVVRLPEGNASRDAAEGGLQIIGTERHESRRIDRQLRGRAGRQGDPGASIFFLSLEDDLMRLFGSERIAGIMDRLGVKEGEVITHPMITRSIEKAQKRVEAYHFGIRKHLLEYDDVMNQQREVIYGRRRSLLFDPDIRNVISDLVSEHLEAMFEECANPRETPDLWNQEELHHRLRRNLQLETPPQSEWGRFTKPADWVEYLTERALQAFDRRRDLYGRERFEPFVRWVALRTVDEKWKDHLYDMDRLKEGVGLRAYGQRDPLIEYKKEGFELFAALLESINEETLRIVYNAVIQEPAAVRPVAPTRVSYLKPEAVAAPVGGAGETDDDGEGEPVAAGPARRPLPRREPVRVVATVGRNDPCPCGSGKKFKKCHGA